MWCHAMPTLFHVEAEFFEPSLYVAMASRNILRAIRISPRCSVVSCGNGASCAHAKAATARLSTRVRPEKLCKSDMTKLVRLCLYFNTFPKVATGWQAI